MSEFYSDNWVKIEKKRLLFGEQLTKCLYHLKMFIRAKSDGKSKDNYYICEMNNELSNAKIDYWTNIVSHRYQNQDKNSDFYSRLNNCMNLGGENYFNLQITDYDDENLLKLFDDLLFVNQNNFHNFL